MAKHPVFGQVIDGMDVVDKIAKVEKDEKDKPTTCYHNRQHRSGERLRF